MAGEDDDRYATDLRESPPPPRSSRSSYQRSFEEDGRKGGFAADVRDKRENGDRFRQRPVHEEESQGKDRGTDENCCNRDQRRQRDGHESDRGRGERSYRSYRHRDEDSERRGDRGDRDSFKI